MIVVFDTANNVQTTHRPQSESPQFAAVMAQYTATPLFSPWPAADQNVRANTAAGNAALNSHPTSSNRREGRHARQ